MPRPTPTPRPILVPESSSSSSEEDSEAAAVPVAVEAEEAAEVACVVAEDRVVEIELVDVAEVDEVVVVDGNTV